MIRQDPGSLGQTLPASGSVVMGSPDSALPARAVSVISLFAPPPVGLNSQETLLTRCRRSLKTDGVLLLAPGWAAAGSAAARLGFAEWSTQEAGPVLAKQARSRSVVVARASARIPGTAPTICTSRDLRDRVARYGPAVSTFVVPVRDEQDNLQKFFAFLEGATNHLQSEREFIAVVNGCTDQSERIARSIARRSSLDLRVITSTAGIVPALAAGITARRLHGFVGKLDADIIVHPLMLDALEHDLLSRRHLKVTHAEPLPADAFCEFSAPDHRLDLVSRRLYFNGKASLYRSDPFGWPTIPSLLPFVRAEDILLSFYAAHYHGHDAIGLARNAVCYQRTVGTFPDLVRMLSRTRSEINRILQAEPKFAALTHLFDQRSFSPSWSQLVGRAAEEVVECDEWLRLPSTK